MPAPKELDPSSSLAALYGAKLRKLRSRTGWTQRELGDKVPVAHSRIAQFELGNETPPRDVSAKLDELLGADGDLTDLWEHVRRTPFPDWARAFVAREAKATKMLKYMAHAVPGLLQTEAYARALLRMSRPRDTDAQVEELVYARLERQAVLRGGSPPLLWCILDEAVIRRPVGGVAVMHGQLNRLLHSAGTPHVVVQLLPFDKGEHPVMGGSLTLLSFGKAHDVAYTESSHSGELLEHPEEVAEYALAYDLLQAKALPPDESLQVIRSVAKEYSTCTPHEPA
ncbi:helix-turn-helix domain-containing protein [Streptomyces albidus (ex Kaewkla and Franco 2022)]|uniref:helix-turn-helix domain-containing protein n=1 Tax=Streptomyces albidus (ex Kaewkla and Franco 2022) TaxID=722709 RepID=UPI0015EF157C|nr:helix-turn-helix transcriptional regulator [Streptomyces albidus (ex Kaewkla and Franco 2022)]